MGIAILVASVSFVLLASAAKTSELRVKGSVKSNFRNAYDILVRPRGSFTPLERSAGLVRDNYLSGVFGGITLSKYEQIKRIRGVDVAAPIANIGYILPGADIPISINQVLNKDPVQLYRVKTTWVADRGLSRYPGSDLYVYYTRRHPFTAKPAGDSPGAPEELTAGGAAPLGVCRGFFDSLPKSYGPFASTPRLSCFSAKSPALNRNNFWSRTAAPKGVGVVSYALFPILLAAIDPIEEARLVRLDRAIVSGRYLRESDRPHVAFSGVPKLGHRFLPLIASTQSYVDETLNVTVLKLRVNRPDDVPKLLASGTCQIPFQPCPPSSIVPPPSGWPRDETAYRFLHSLKGSPVAHERIPVTGGYRLLLYGRSPLLKGSSVTTSNTYWTVSGTSYRAAGRDVLAPRTVVNPAAAYANRFNGENGGFYYLGGENQDVQFRRLRPHAGSNDFLGDNVLATPSFQIVGRYDPRRLPGFSPLSKVPLETYYPPELEPGDRVSSDALRGKPLLPTQNLGDYVQQPPLMLTTLSALPVFTNPKYFAGANARAPISVIRVRVTGVTGPDELSQTRIRTVALQIHERTGLDVDITAGSSPHPLAIRLPKGKFGRPALTLNEGWVKKGVSVSFLSALDQKELALFALIPVICAFFLANGAFAAVRARRAEIGTLLTLGWSQGAIFRVVLGELSLIGLVSGLLGTGLAAGIVALFALDASLFRTLLVLPVSVTLAVIAGLVPAARAARVSPLDAIRPVIAGRERSGHARSLISLARVNLRRLPGRTLIGVGGLFVGVAALTVLVGIEQAFQGTLVGTLLGNAISLQIRGVDFLAVSLTIALAALALADVLYLNLRERAAEFVTLRTVGWEERHLVALLELEALGLGLLGGVGGALAGFAIGAILLGVSVGPLAFGAFLAAAGGTVVALLASMFPLAQLRRLTPPTVLAAE